VVYAHYSDAGYNRVNSYNRRMTDMPLTRRQRHERILENFGRDRVARLIHNEITTKTISIT